MKNSRKITHIIFILISLLILYLAIINNDIFINTFIDTLNLWLYKVMPPIFTFYILISLLLHFNILQKILILFKPLNIILKFNSYKSLYLYLIGIFIGNPSSANIISEAYKNNEITYKDYNSLITNCSFITPLFIFSIFQNNLLISSIIFFTHIISNLIVTSIYNYKTTTNNNIQLVNNMNISTNISNIFSNATLIVLNIASIMVFSNLIISSLKLLNFPLLLLLPLELSTGIFNALQLFDNTSIQIIIISILLSFNGFCIHLQISSQVINFKYKSFVLIRLIQSIFSGFLSYFIWYIVTSLTP